MKKTIILSTITSSLLFALTPIHQKMDNRTLGKSFGGVIDDHIAAEDGLGIIPLNGYTVTQDVANELIAHKVYTRILKSDIDISLKKDIRSTVENNLAGTIDDRNLLSSAGIVICNDGILNTMDIVEGGVCKHVYPNSCKQLLNYDKTIADGTYKIQPYSTDSSNVISVSCDMTNGGWTGITACQAKNNLGGSLNPLDGATGSFDGNCGPRFRDGSGDGLYQYDFDVPFGFSQFKFDSSYYASAYSGSGYTSELSTNENLVSIGLWGLNGHTTDGANGKIQDIAFGSWDKPVASFVNEGIAFNCTTCSRAFTTKIYNVSNPGAGHFRIQFGEKGGEYEGWAVWPAGKLYLK